MVSFDAFRAVDGTPVYLQIIRYIKRGAVAGTIRDGDELPSRRVLSALLGINPNTVQKAFHLLEEEQLIESRTGAKSCMTKLPIFSYLTIRVHLIFSLFTASSEETLSG